MYAFYDFIVFFLPNPFAELDLGLELWIFAEELKVFFFLSFLADRTATQYDRLLG